MGNKILRLFWFGVLMAVCKAALGHPEIDLQIQEASQQITQYPANADLYLKRGELYRRHSDLGLAREDLEKARTLEPSHRLLNWYEGRVALDARDFPVANQKFSLYIESEPAHAPVFYLRGMARDGLGQYLFAAEDYARSIGLSKNPAPALFRSQALSLIAANDWQASGHIINAGLSRYPREVSLLGIAVELSLIRQDTHQALAYFTRLPERLRSLPQWRFRKAVWHCVSGEQEAAADVFRSLVAPTEPQQVSRTGTWDVPVAAISNLIEQPQVNACVELVKELLASQAPRGLENPPTG